MITGQVLDIVYRVISMHLVKKAGGWKIGSPYWCGNVDLQVTALGTLLPLNFLVLSIAAGRFLPLIVKSRASAFVDFACLAAYVAIMYQHSTK